MVESIGVPRRGICIASVKEGRAVSGAFDKLHHAAPHVEEVVGIACHDAEPGQSVKVVMNGHSALFPDNTWKLGPVYMLPDGILTQVLSLEAEEIGLAIMHNRVRVGIHQIGPRKPIGSLQ